MSSKSFEEVFNNVQWPGGDVNGCEHDAAKRGWDALQSELKQMKEDREQYFKDAVQYASDMTAEVDKREGKIDNLRTALTKALPLLKTYDGPAWKEAAELVERVLGE